MVSPDFYLFIKEAVDFYYLNDENYDENMFGLTLQHQHTVLGRTGAKTVPNIENVLESFGSPTFFKYQLLGKIFRFEIDIRESEPVSRDMGCCIFP